MVSDQFGPIATRYSKLGAWQRTSEQSTRAGGKFSKSTLPIPPMLVARLSPEQAKYLLETGAARTLRADEQLIYPA